MPRVGCRAARGGRQRVPGSFLLHPGIPPTPPRFACLTVIRLRCSASIRPQDKHSRRQGKQTTRRLADDGKASAPQEDKHFHRGSYLPHLPCWFACLMVIRLRYSASIRPQDKHSRREGKRTTRRLADDGKASGPARARVDAVRTSAPAKQKPPARKPGARPIRLAVTVGFEPTVACTTLAFEASSFGRSDTSPPMSVSQPGPADKFAGRLQPTTTSKVPTRSAIPAARSSIIPTSWRRPRQFSGIPLRPYSAPASCP